MSRTLAALTLAALLCAGPARAAALRECDPGPPPTAAQHDKLLRFAALVRTTLEASGAGTAIVARSGLDLDRFGVRYSHAGLSARESRHAPWAVRQLYYDCSRSRPRLYDQGLPGFVFGTHEAARGYVFALLLPAREGGALQRAALDEPRALALLGARYSANAYAFGERYQNCNQWLAELIALAWGDLPAAGSARRDAQRWLQDAGYAPSVFDVGPLVALAGSLVPWLHVDDHPEADRERATFRVSMPAAIEAFVRARLPGAQRIEFCHDETRLVVRRGWRPIADGCVPEDGDEVVDLAA